MLQELEYELEAESELEMEFESEFESGRESQIIGADTRVHVTNTRVAPYRYICHIAEGGRPLGSGTLIGPNTVLTAAHVVQGTNWRRLVAIPGRNADRVRGDIRPFGIANAAAPPRIAPGFTTPVTPQDYAVFYLRQPIGNTVGYWTIAHRSSRIDPLGTSISGAPLPLPPGNLRVNLSGYPGDKGFAFGNPPQQLRQQWRAYNRAVQETGGMLHYLNDTFGGHSGCPVWVKRSASNGGRVMVAIHLGGDDNIGVVANRAVRITPGILAQIRRWLAAAPPVRPTPRPGPARPFRILDRFQFDRPGVQPHHRPIIQEIARTIVSSAGSPRAIHTVRLVGHADSAGGDTYNLNLGQQRSLAVQRELTSAIERLRPGHSRRISIVTQSLGEAHPIAPNTTPENRARNRRVEVTLAGR
jgi:V8-like Glu-specific endopeptidase